MKEYLKIGKKLIIEGKLTKNMEKPGSCYDCPLHKASSELGYISCSHFNMLVLGREVESRIHLCREALELVYNALKKDNRYLKI